MKRHLAVLAVFVGMTVCGVAAQTNAAAADPWAGLRFLIGSWEAKTDGGSAQTQGAGDYSFRLDLGGKVLARHSATSGCKGPKDFDCQHSDLLYVYPANGGQGWQAIYFDNEGHVIHYAVTVPKAGTAQFLSDESQPGPQFRLVYELAGGTMRGKFQMKMPRHGEFRSYLEWWGGAK